MELLDLLLRMTLLLFAIAIVCLLGSAAVEDYRQDREAWKRRAKRWR